MSGERGKIRVRAGRLFGDFSYGEEATLGELRDELADAIAKHGEGAYAHQDTECSECDEPVANIGVGIWVERDETDAEVERREQHEAVCAREKERRERAEFERLKAKFGATA